MSQKWNLQDIKPPENRRHRIPPANRPAAAPEPRVVKNEDDGTMRIAVENGNQRKRVQAYVVAAIFVVLIAGGFLASYFTSGATVTVHPRTSTPMVNAEFTAYKAPPAGELAYEIMRLEAEGERQVAASGQEEASVQATGMIEIFKTTPGAQRLIKNTRFESSDGLIYKITESVVVPGAVDGSPGSIRANVFAENPGEAYNLESGRFTVPGLESDQALFSAIYAEPVGPINGGFEGQRFIIDEAELQTAKQALQMELRDALLERVPNEKPAGFVVFDEAVTFTYQDLPAVEYGENLATIKQKAILQIPLFKQDEFAAYIAAATVPGYESRPVRINDYSALEFSYPSATTSSTDISTLDEITFSITGKPLIVWQFDQGKLATDLMGVSKTALSSVIGGYPAIENVESEIRPFWKTSFPDEVEDIEILESLEPTAS